MFSSAATVFVKMGVKDVDTTLATAIETDVVENNKRPFFLI